MGKRNDGLMGLFIGITRSGKSTPIKAMIPKAKRLLIWDAKNEYGGAFNLTVIRSLSDLLDSLRHCKTGGRFAYVPTGYSKPEFDTFCRLAHTWNRQSPAVIVVEELAAVTHSGKAAGFWGVLVNQSLGLGATLLATVQRGQEVDKSVMNACSYVYICQHNTDDDARYAAKKFGVAITQIPRKPLEFMIWSPAKGAMVSGYVEFQQNGKPVFIRKGAGKRRLSLGATVGTFKGVSYR